MFEFGAVTLKTAEELFNAEMKSLPRILDSTEPCFDQQKIGLVRTQDTKVTYASHIMYGICRLPY